MSHKNKSDKCVDSDKKPMISVIQADYECMLEHRKTKLYKRLSIIELFVIVILAMRCIHDRF